MYRCPAEDPTRSKFISFTQRLPPIEPHALRVAHRLRYENFRLPKDEDDGARPSTMRWMPSPLIFSFILLVQKGGGMT